MKAFWLAQIDVYNLAFRRGIWHIHCFCSHLLSYICKPFPTIRWSVKSKRYLKWFYGKFRDLFSRSVASMMDVYAEIVDTKAPLTNFDMVLNTPLKLTLRKQPINFCLRNHNIISISLYCLRKRSCFVSHVINMCMSQNLTIQLLNCNAFQIILKIAVFDWILLTKLLKSVKLKYSGNRFAHGVFMSFHF